MITFFTDPHLGTTRKANTTAKSSKLLQEAITEAAYEPTRRFKETSDCVNDSLVCLGDLFDKSTNTEAVFVEGLKVAYECKWLLSGNHDETNREGVVTTLQAVDKALTPLTSPVVSRPSFDSVQVTTDYDEATNSWLHLVPHHPSQEQFLKALDTAVAYLGSGDPEEAQDNASHLLCLHCSYDSPYAAEDGAELNLTIEKAKQLLEAGFSYILLGHEHAPKVHLDGRLIILGNTHPTSFADISDKYYWTWDGSSFERFELWSERKHTLDIPFGSDLQELSEQLEAAQFITVVGSEGAGTGPEVAEFVNRVWAKAPEALMVRSKVEIVDHLQDLNEAGESPALIDLSERIRSELHGSDLNDLFETILKESQQ